MTSKIRNRIVVDLRDLRLDGKTLDLGFEGKGIIYRALQESMMNEDYEEVAISAEGRKSMDDCNWVYGYPDSLPFEDSSFDTVIAFFSLSFIKRKYIRNKAVKEIHRVLRRNGKFYVWDINTGLFSLCLKRKLEVILPHNNTIEMDITGAGRICNYNVNSLIPVIKRYFNIYESNNCGRYFIIEAAKKDGIT